MWCIKGEWQKVFGEQRLGKQSPAGPRADQRPNSRHSLNKDISSFRLPNSTSCRGNSCSSVGTTPESCAMCGGSSRPGCPIVSSPPSCSSGDIRVRAFHNERRIAVRRRFIGTKHSEGRDVARVAERRQTRVVTRVGEGSRVLIGRAGIQGRASKCREEFLTRACQDTARWA